MIVASEHQAKLRQKEIQEIDEGGRQKEHEEAKKNNLHPDIPKGLATH